MSIASISQLAGAYNAQSAQARGATASAEVMQAATVMLMKESTDIAEHSMDALLAGMMQSLTHLGQNIDLTV